MSYAPGTYYARNREKVLARVKRYREANLNREKLSKIKRRYGLTEQQLLELRTAQEGRCAICYNATEKLYVDHCHASGIVRGLLCHGCNSLLGMAEDNAQILRNAINYLETKGAKPPSKSRPQNCGRVSA